MRARTRREALVAGAGGALGLLAATSPAARGALRLVEGGLRQELLTVTPTGFAAWWRTDAPADTILRLARADGRGGIRELRLARGQTVHAAGVDDLEPGTRYRYELRSSGRAVPVTPDNPGHFRTLPRPQGALLARIAVLNDLHVGESCSGTITNVEGTSVPPCFKGDDYAHRMTAAALDEVRASAPDLVVANGDLTDRGRPRDIDRALELLRGTGLPFLVTRGNHDRRLHETGSPPDGDVLRAAAFPSNPVGDHVLKSVARVGARVAVVGLDSCDPDSGRGRLDLRGQLAWLERTLTTLRAERRTTLVALHHHVANVANASHPPPLTFGVRADSGALDFLQILGRHDHVPLVLSGHTHRNYVARDLLAPRTVFLENGATKEYPAGWALLEIHEDAIVRTFHRAVTPFTREWVRTSAQQIYGRHPDYTRGTPVSRSFVLRTGGIPVGPRPSLFGPV